MNQCTLLEKTDKLISFKFEIKEEKVQNPQNFDIVKKLTDALKNNRDYSKKGNIEKGIEYDYELLKCSEGLKKSCLLGNHSFLEGVLLAYSYHNHLIIKPDDVWIAILTQFSMYVNKNSEKLRSKFVNHDGKKELVAIVPFEGALENIPYEEMTLLMSNILANNLKDESIRNWAVPSFSTTTEKDKLVGIVVMMSMFKRYFTYKYSTMCGFPRITMQGTPLDWETIETKANKLLEFDCGDGLMKKWLSKLLIVLKELTNSSKGNISSEFWSKIISHDRESGKAYISGWITVFAVFNDENTWVGDNNVASFFSGQIKTEWHFLDNNHIPIGFASVPVTLQHQNKNYNTELYAGHIGGDIYDSTVQPQLDWAILLKKEKK